MNKLRLTAFISALLMLSGCASGEGSSSVSEGSKATESSKVQSEAESAPDSKADTPDNSSDTDKKDYTVPSYNENESVVSFSKESGVYGEAFSLELCSPDGGDIWYTTDGSDPRSSSTRQKYSAAISIAKRDDDPNVVSAVDPALFSGNFAEIDFGAGGFGSKMKAPSDDAVDKITVVRACAEMSDGTVTKPFAGSYFIGTAEEHIQGLAESCKAMGTSLAVMSISMNYDDLFDPSYGIYVKGDIFTDAAVDYFKNGGQMNEEAARQIDANYKQKGRTWERPADATLMEISPDGSSVTFSQQCGVRIQGNYSRSDLIKGLRLFARKDYGEKRFEGNVFEGLKSSDGEDMTSFKSLVLRAGGNCAFTAKFNDTYWQKMSESLDCSTKASRPCVVYLNGEYWGLYLLEEDYSDDYFADHYGVEKTDVIVYKGDAEALALGYKLDEGELPEGETNESYYFQPLLNFFKKHKSLTSQEDYDAFAELVDIESCRDYFLSEVWINNKWDWPGKNWSMWKTSNVDPSNEYADGKWRFMFYDMEFGGVSGSSDCGTNTIKEDNYKPKGLLDMGTNNPAVLCYAYLMTNEGFRTDYLARLEGLSEGIYAQDKLQAMLDDLTAQYSPLFEQFFTRYPGTGSADEAVNGGYASAKCIGDFIKGRAKNISKIVSWVEKQF